MTTMTPDELVAYAYERYNELDWVLGQIAIKCNLDNEDRMKMADIVRSLHEVLKVAKAKNLEAEIEQIKREASA